MANQYVGVLGLVVATLTGASCAPATYRIPGAEMQRLASLAPQHRGDAVRVVPPTVETEYLAAAPAIPPVAPAPTAVVDATSGPSPVAELLPQATRCRAADAPNGEAAFDVDEACATMAPPAPPACAPRCLPPETTIVIDESPPEVDVEVDGALDWGVVGGGPGRGPQSRSRRTRPVRAPVVRGAPPSANAEAAPIRGAPPASARGAPSPAPTTSTASPGVATSAHGGPAASPTAGARTSVIASSAASAPRSVPSSSSSRASVPFGSGGSAMSTHANMGGLRPSSSAPHISRPAIPAGGGVHSASIPRSSSAGRGGGARHGGGHDSGSISGGDAVVAIVAVIAVVGMLALIAEAASEEQPSFDGWAQLSPEQPLHLRYAQGIERIVLLRDLRPTDIRGLRDTIVRDIDRPIVRLPRSAWPGAHPSTPARAAPPAPAAMPAPAAAAPAPAAAAPAPAVREQPHPS